MKRLSAGEGAHERLISLLAQVKGEGSAPTAVGAAALLAALSGGKGGKETLLALRKPLVTTLNAQLLSPRLALTEQAATALGNLSVHAELRAEMVDSGAVEVCCMRLSPSPQ